MLYLILNYLRDLLRPRGDLFLENLALRQRINVLRRGNPKPAFRLRDRLFWIVLMRTERDCAGRWVSESAATR